MILIEVWYNEYSKPKGFDTTFHKEEHMMKNVLKAIALVGTGVVLTLGTLVVLTYSLAEMEEREYEQWGN